MEKTLSDVHCAEVKNCFSILVIAPGSREETLLLRELYHWLMLKGHIVPLFKREWGH